MCLRYYSKVLSVDGIRDFIDFNGGELYREGSTRIVKHYYLIGGSVLVKQVASIEVKIREGVFFYYKNKWNEEYDRSIDRRNKLKRLKKL